MHNIKLIFIRHGDYDLNRGKLTIRGKKQIKEALKYIKNENVDAIFCSPRTRTLQSANILNDSLKVPMYILKEFNERLPLINPAEIIAHKEEYDVNYLNYEYRNENFETCKDFIDRCFEGIEKVIAKVKACSTVIICAHSSTLYAINAYVNGIPEDNYIKWLQCGNGNVIKFYI